MKILITGASGLLGQEVWRVFEKEHELVALGRTQPPQVPSAQWRTVDLSDEEAVYPLITRENADLIVHTAAFNDVDGAQKNPDAAYRGNALACRNLAVACQRFDSILLSVSSDYVFDGQNPPAAGYREFDACRPLSHYAESKYWGELFVSQLLNKFFIVRTSWLFGPGRETWADKAAAAFRDGAPVKAASDMTSAPTYTPDLAEALLRLAQSRHYGYYHLTNGGFCSRVQWAEEIGRLTAANRKNSITSLTQAQLGLPAPRPRHSGLDNLAWRLDGQTPLRPWQQALAAHFEKVSVAK